MSGMEVSAVSTSVLWQVLLFTTQVVSGCSCWDLSVDARCPEIRVHKYPSLSRHSAPGGFRGSPGPL